MDYPVKLEQDDNGTVLVSFPDFPEAHTFGDDIEGALRHAEDALATAIDAYIKDRRDIPLPSAMVAKHRVTMPALMEAKIALYETMRQEKVSKAELARRLNWHPPQVDRLLAMTHSSKLGQLEAALRVLNKQLVVAIEPAPALTVHRAGKRARRRSARLTRR